MTDDKEDDVGTMRKAVVGGVLIAGLVLSELAAGVTGRAGFAATAEDTAAQEQVATPGPAGAAVLGRLDAAVSASTPGSPAHLRLLEERARDAQGVAVREVLLSAELCRIRAALAMGTPGSPGYLRLWDQAEMVAVQAGESAC